jgi:GT2 family glycosyltransferase
VRATVVVPTYNRSDLLDRCLRSLIDGGAPDQLLVVDNGSTDGTPDILRRYPDVDVIRLPTNEGFSRAVNRAAREAEGDALVLVNNDCVCEPGFVRALARALEPRDGVVMAAGVLRDARDPSLIDTAGMELDATLLPFDYLNGEPLSVLAGPVQPPVGPSAAAAAFNADAFRDAGGFDENLFAYWEDVDLVLRLRLAGGRCVLARDARGTHEHSATLGSGSREKNYLMGFGRGYVLRKWSVLRSSHLVTALPHDAIVCIGQMIVDRNAAGVRGRLAGLRAAAVSGRRQPYPAAVLRGYTRGTLPTLARRAVRRGRLANRNYGARPSHPLSQPNPPDRV